MALSREQKLQKKKDYYYANREVVLERNRKYRNLHREEIRERTRLYHKRYYAEHKDEIIERTNKYNKANKKMVAIWARERRKNPESWRRTRENENRYRNKKLLTDSGFKLNYNMSRSIRIALNRTKNGRKWQQFVGCSLLELKQHLERMFTKDMNWTNYGSYWHIDHIIPKSFFYYTSAEDEEFLLCWNYTNLQPMEATANLRKSNKYIGLCLETTEIGRNF